MFLENRASKEAGISMHSIYRLFQTVIPLIGCRVQVSKTHAAIGNISYLELKVYFQENIKGEAIDIAQCLRVLTALTKKRFCFQLHISQFTNTSDSSQKE